MSELTLAEFKSELKSGARAILLVRHAERPKMDPDDPSFGDALAITDEGVRTARLLGTELRDFAGETTFVASPLTRTRMTAACIAEGMGIADAPVATDGKLGNDSFYYDDPSKVLEVFRPRNFFNACFEYYRTGEMRGFKNLHRATDEMERWLFVRLERKLLVAVTHDCYVAAFLSARKAVPEFTRANWVRFLDGGATLVYPDGSRRYALVRTGLSDGICGVGGVVV